MIGLYFEAFVIGVATGAVYAIVAIGFNLVFGVLNIFNFAFGAIMMMATYGALLVFRFVTDSFWVIQPVRACCGDNRRIDHRKGGGSPA